MFIREKKREISEDNDAIIAKILSTSPTLQKLLDNCKNETQKQETLQKILKDQKMKEKKVSKQVDVESDWSQPSES